MVRQLRVVAGSPKWRSSQAFGEPPDLPTQRLTLSTWVSSERSS